MDIEGEEAAWDIVRERINFDIESGEFIAIDKNSDGIINNDGGLPAGQSAEEEVGNGEERHILDLDNQPGSSNAPPKMAKVSGPSKKSTNLIVESLIGQANMEHARGQTKKAMAYLFQAIKLSPYFVQTYKEISDIYAELNQREKSFEFKMLAALLDSKTTAQEWDDIAELAQSFERLELAVACLSKAIRRDPGNWIYYEKRIQILDTAGDTELAMRTRLQAAHSVNSQTSQIGFAWIDKHIKTAADYYCRIKDEERATEALETFIFRSREFGRPIEFELLALLGMWMDKGRYEESAKAILAFQHQMVQAMKTDGSLAIQIEFSAISYKVEPFPPEQKFHWVVDASFSTMFLSHLTICLIHMQQFHQIDELIEKLLERPVGMEEENAYLEIARSLHVQQQIGIAVDYMRRLRAARPEFMENADAWFLYGYFNQLLDQSELARSAYEQVIKIQPDHIDARINLSTILQQMGQGELAMETLKGLSLDQNCSQIPDERLLVRQVEMLAETTGTRSPQYINCLRMLLIPHFYTIHLMGEELVRVRGLKRKTGDKFLHLGLKRRAMEVIRGSQLEKVVKRLGSSAFQNHRPLGNLSANELNEYAFKFTEALHLASAYEETLVVVCYAFLHPKIAASLSQHFNNLLFFASINARNFPLAFEYTRFHLTYILSRANKNTTGGFISANCADVQPHHRGVEKSQEMLESLKRINAAMNFVFCQHQSVNYHRFIMRQLVKQPESDALHIISGNNSLVTGAYRHALGEYFSIWLRHRNHPMLAFLISITFTHIACKKDISSRHVVAIRALAFFSKYATTRVDSLDQEVQYNMGRMFHQMGILPNAIKCYERVLYECPIPLVWVEDPDGFMAPRTEPAERYDLRRQAAYNLSLIYDSSGNRPMARHILEEFCTI